MECWLPVSHSTDIFTPSRSIFRLTNYFLWSPESFAITGEVSMITLRERKPKPRDFQWFSSYLSWTTNNVTHVNCGGGDARDDDLEKWPYWWTSEHHFRPMRETCGAVIPKHHPVDKRLRITWGISKYMFLCVCAHMHACILGFYSKWFWFHNH